MLHLNFSIPMVAVLDENHPLIEYAMSNYDKDTIRKLIAESFIDTPEFETALKDANKNGSWCVIYADPEYSDV